MCVLNLNMKIYLLILLILFSTICKSQTLLISVSKNKFGKDETLSLIVSQIHNIENYQNIGIYNEIIISFENNDYRFISNPNYLDYSNSYLIEDLNTLSQYTLYFTEIPIIIINSGNPIIDEPKVFANFVYTDQNKTINSNIGIELRGVNSQNYPKKTYDIEFWEDEIGYEKIDVKFGELREDDDWILDALYNEPLRIRSYIANKLWKEMHTPNYIDYEIEAKSGADVMYVEMFLNGKYNGIYNISEQVDRKQLKLKKFNGNIRGELYKGISWGASTFSNLTFYNNSNRIWSGYEFEYPNEDDITDWNNLYQFTDFVINSSESDFITNVWTEFNKANFIDYFLFINLIRGTDNTGKNIYLGKYREDEPYFYVPWDLDGCFGTIWNGTNENITDDILINGFIYRVLDENPSNTFTNIASNWFDYRDDIFSLNSLSKSITNIYNFFLENKVYERESLVYDNDLFDSQSLSYILNWLENRLTYLDNYFTNINSYNFTISSIKFKIYPNPATNKILISSAKGINNKNFKIFNSLGQIISSGYIKNQQIKIEHLERGLYYINIGGKSVKMIKN